MADSTSGTAENSISLAQQMREGMRRLASGVCVVTANDDGGERFAMTASSVTSVSDNPPSLLICVNVGARIHDVIESSDTFCVNVLSSAHEAVSNTCAVPETPAGRFAVGQWQQEARSGLYYLEDAESVFICRKVNSLVHGTHTIFIGNIEQVQVSAAPVSPLVYIDGGYST